MYPKYIQNTYNSILKDSAIKKWAEEPKRQFSEGDIQIANRYKKKCSISLLISKILTKIMKYSNKEQV